MQNAMENTTTDVGMRSWITLAALVANSVAFQNADFVAMMTKRKMNFCFATKSLDFINKIWLKILFDFIENMRHKLGWIFFYEKLVYLTRRFRFNQKIQSKTNDSAQKITTENCTNWL